MAKNVRIKGEDISIDDNYYVLYIILKEILEKIRENK